MPEELRTEDKHKQKLVNNSAQTTEDLQSIAALSLLSPLFLRNVILYNPTYLICGLHTAGGEAWKYCSTNRHNKASQGMAERRWTAQWRTHSRRLGAKSSTVGCIAVDMTDRTLRVSLIEGYRCGLSYSIQKRLLSQSCCMWLSHVPCRRQSVVMCKLRRCLLNVIKDPNREGKTSKFPQRQYCCEWRWLYRSGRAHRWKALIR
jgi:ribulose bisphosphate carboxylase small subunit